MKKAYSLDYTIERDVDRNKAVYDILDKLSRDPSPSELEQMANYILYGKDENGKNAIQRKEATDSNTRYANFKRLADKNESLDELLANPNTNEAALVPLDEAPRYIYSRKRPTIARPKHDAQGNEIDPGDGDIPGMRELWAAIDRVERTYYVAIGKLEPNENDDLITSDYKIYKLQHQLMDMRRHQYYLKDAYKPTIKFFRIEPPEPQTYDWDSDAQYWCSLEEWKRKTTNTYTSTISTDLSDYQTRINDKGETEVLWVVRRHNFDWEDPTHIKALIRNYSAVRQQVQEKLYSWGRTLIYDFDRYQDLACLTPVRQYILDHYIDGHNSATISNELREDLGVSYHATRITSIIMKEIPELLAATAKRNRLMIETPESDLKKCYTCKRKFPRDSLFFAHNNDRKDGWASNCKECERQKRIKKGGQSAYDRRVKDPEVLKMQAAAPSKLFHWDAK